MASSATSESCRIRNHGEHRHLKSLAWSIRPLQLHTAQITVIKMRCLGQSCLDLSILFFLWVARSTSDDVVVVISSKRRETNSTWPKVNTDCLARRMTGYITAAHMRTKVKDGLDLARTIPSPRERPTRYSADAATNPRPKGHTSIPNRRRAACSRHDKMRIRNSANEEAGNAEACTPRSAIKSSPHEVRCQPRA